MTFTENGGRPGDQRGFIHKKFFGAVSKVAGVLPIPGAGAISTITRALAGGSQQKKAFGRSVKFGNGGVPLVPTIVGAVGGCPEGFELHVPTGTCRVKTPGARGARERFFPGGATGFETPDAVAGRYGAAFVPTVMTVQRAVCNRGQQLGDDGLCYNKAQISNKQRMWPAGRKPLLSGGDMRAISIASRAARRLEGTTKRLQRMGMMKKPATRRALPAHQHAKLLPAVSV